MNKLYLLLAILYIAYSVYRAIKKNAEAKSPPRKEAPKSRPSFEDMIEEMLTGQKKVRPVAGPEIESFDEEAIAGMETDYEPAVSLESIPEKEYFSYELASASSIFSDPRTLTDLDRGQSSSRHHKGPDMSWLYEGDGFDLRKAVVYSEILNRPYT